MHWRGRAYRVALAVALLTIAASLPGCHFNSAPQRSLAPAGTPRAGEVYLVRGLFGTFSTGMDQLQRELSHRGIRSVAFQHTEGSSAAQQIINQYRPGSGPIVLVGHSLGADEAVDIARRLNNARVPVALLITLDPVTADPIPANVRRATNYYRSRGLLDLVPALRGIPLKAESTSPTIVRNIDLGQHTELLEPGLSHFNIDNNSYLQSIIVSQILSVCPPELDPRNSGELRDARDPRSPSRAIRASATLDPDR